MRDTDNQLLVAHLPAHSAQTGEAACQALGCSQKVGSLCTHGRASPLLHVQLTPPWGLLLSVSLNTYLSVLGFGPMRLARENPSICVQASGKTGTCDSLPQPPAPPQLPQNCSRCLVLSRACAAGGAPSHFL